MGKIAASLFVSLDGVMETPEDWTAGYVTEEVQRVPYSLIDGGDVLLLGRVTYQTFAEAFGGEKADNPFASLMTEKSKVVVSSTLDKAEWANSTLISDDVAEGIAELKREPGKTISISGSPTLVGWLLREGLLDELDVLVFPVVVGSGRRVFEGDGGVVALDLLSTETFDNGVVHHTFTRADSAA